MRKFYKFEYGKYALNTSGDNANNQDKNNDISSSYVDPNACGNAIVANAFRKASTFLRVDQTAVTPSNMRSENSSSRMIEDENSNNDSLESSILVSDDDPDDKPNIKLKN